MKRILQEYLQKNHGIGDYILNDTGKIISILDDLKPDVLYKSDFHGLYHSQKVCLYAYIIGTSMGLDKSEMKIILDAAKYHDIGRENDSENTTHGYVAALRIDKVVNYSNPDDIYYLKAIIDAHSVPDKEMDLIYSNWNEKKHDDDVALKKEKSKDLDYEKFKKLCSILKDADALDRFRFKNCPAELDENYLRTDAAKNHKLIEVAKIINDYYRKVEAEEQYKAAEGKFNKFTFDKSICYHSVGFDFFKALSILEHGILSYYRAEKNNIELSRNFNGNNSDFWISVVDANQLFSQPKAFDKYVKNGISFLCYVDQLVPGVTRAKDNGSLEPRNSEYCDEKFVFDSIPLEHIQFMLIPKKYMDTSITDLEYLYCNSNYETIKNNVNRYLGEIEQYCDIKLNRNNINRVLSELFQVQINYNIAYYHSEFDERMYFLKIDHMKAALNLYIQESMQIGFCELMEKTIDEKITLKEVVEFILKRNGIEYTEIQSDGNNDSYLSSNEIPSFDDKGAFMLRLSTFDLNKTINLSDFDKSRSI